MYLQTLVILLSIGRTVCDFLLIHESCQYWPYLSIYGDGKIKQLHCILDQDFQSGLVYTDWKMLLGGTCPIYNRYAEEIDSISCNRNIGICPNKSYPSYYGVTYTGCYEAIRKQTNVRNPATNEDVHVPPVTSDICYCPTALVPITTVFASFVCISIIACVWHFTCRTKMKLCRDTFGIPESKVEENITSVVTKSDEHKSRFDEKYNVNDKEDMENGTSTIANASESDTYRITVDEKYNVSWTEEVEFRNKSINASQSDNDVEQQKRDSHISIAESNTSGEHLVPVQ